MIAVLSDVHANFEALSAVVRDIAKRGVTRIIYLGDIIGYGPEPRRVLDFIWKFEFCIMGNHDRAVLTGPPKYFNPIAQRATTWTRKQIHPSEMAFRFLRPKEYRLRKQYWSYLMALPTYRRVNEMLFAHDNPISPGNDRYIRTAEEADMAFDKHPDIRVFFIGHSHVPAIFRPGKKLPVNFGKKYNFDGRLLINVGSVGQPRDKDPRACYVIVDDGFRFVRVPYDIKKTQAKIRGKPLDPMLAERLATGT